MFIIAREMVKLEYLNNAECQSFFSFPHSFSSSFPLATRNRDRSQIWSGHQHRHQQSHTLILSTSPHSGLPIRNQQKGNLLLGQRNTKMSSNSGADEESIKDVQVRREISLSLSSLVGVVGHG
jgi:hypothetical protein